MLAIRKIDPLGFYLLPAGEAIDDGSSLLQSNFASDLIKVLSSSYFNWILIDSPPTIPIADILVLKAHAEATLLVARAGKTPRETIEETTRNLGRDHIIGIILNGVEGLDRVYSKYYGYGASEPNKKPNKSRMIEGLGLNEREK
jgi:non-specific protein-tyrosine kinase